MRGGKQLSQLTISGCSGVTDELMLRLHRRHAQQAQQPGKPAGHGPAAASSSGSRSPASSQRGGQRAEEQQAQQGARALRVLSMVGSKALRHVHLGLMPAALAAARGLALAPVRPPPAAALPAGRDVALAAQAPAPVAAARAGPLEAAAGGGEGEQGRRGEGGTILDLQQTFCGGHQQGSIED